MGYIPFSSALYDYNTPGMAEISNYYPRPVLYYVIDSKGGRGYIGQSTKGLSRLAEHIIRGYSDPSYHSGAANIIRTNTCRNTYFRYYTADKYFGVPESLKYFLGIPTTTNNYLGHWEYRARGINTNITDLDQLEPEQILDLAEVIHIIYNRQHGNDLSSENIKGGGSAGFKIFYYFSEYEVTRICFLLNSLGVQMSSSRLSSKINKYELTSQDLATNTLKVVDPVSDVLIRELLEEDVLSQIVQSQDFIDEVGKACYNVKTFKAFVEKNRPGHAAALKQVSSALNDFLQQKMQKIIKNVIYKLGNCNIDVDLSTENDFDFTSLLRSIGQALQTNVKGKKFNTLSEALNTAFKTNQGQFRKLNLHITHKFYANVKVSSSPTEAPWLAAMDTDWNNRHMYCIDVENSTDFVDWIKKMSFIGFYNNYTHAAGSGLNIDFEQTLMQKTYDAFSKAGVRWGWAWEPYYRSNATLVQYWLGNPLHFEFNSKEIETAGAKFGGDLTYVHAWPTSLMRLVSVERDSWELGEAREYLFLEETANKIVKLQDTLRSATQLKFY